MHELTNQTTKAAKVLAGGDHRQATPTPGRLSHAATLASSAPPNQGEHPRMPIHTCGNMAAV